MNLSSSVKFGAGLQPTQMTMPDELLCHYITDEQLLSLGEATSGMSKEISLVSLGGFLGSFVPGIDGLRRFNDKTHPSTVTDLLSMMLLTVTFILFVVTLAQWRSKAKSHVGLVDAIRSRPKVGVDIG